MKKIKEVISPMFNGITMPLRCILDDGKYVVFKMFNNPEGNRVLVNEFIALAIAKKLQLPIPDGGVANIDDDTLINEFQFEDFSNSDVNKGYGFYSYLLENVTPGLEGVAGMLQSFCINKQDFMKIMLFDHLIYNGDRNNGNLLWDMKNKKIYIIDHSHCFYLGPLWTSIQLQMCIKANDYTHTTILENNKYIYDLFYDITCLDEHNLYRTSEEFKSLITDDFLTSIINNVPDCWEASMDELVSLKNYILYRLENIDYMCDLIVNNRR